MIVNFAVSLREPVSEEQLRNELEEAVTTQDNPDIGVAPDSVGVMRGKLCKGIISVQNKENHLVIRRMTKFKMLVIRLKC